MRRKSMPVLSVPGALVGGDEVSMAVFHELSRGEGPSPSGENTHELHSHPKLPCRLFFFNDTATTEIYTLSLHDALPICQSRGRSWVAMKSAWQFFMSFRGPKAHPNRGEKPPRGVGSE